MRGRRDEVILGRYDRRLTVDVDPAPQAIGVDDLAAVEAGQGAREVAHVLDRAVSGSRVGFERAVEQRHGHVTHFVCLVWEVLVRGAAAEIRQGGW